MTSDVSLSHPRSPWPLACAIIGFALAVLGLLTAVIFVRLLVLLVWMHDFGMYPVELWGAPLCLSGIILCLFGARHGKGFWLARIGLLVGIAGLLVSVFFGVATLTFNGGSV